MRLYAALGGAALVLALVAAIFWFRGEAIKAKAERDNWKEAAETYKQVNETNLSTIATLKRARDANDKLATDLAAEVAAIRARGVETRTVIREIYRNEPEARAWGDMPVPDSVRNAAQARR